MILVLGDSHIAGLEAPLRAALSEPVTFASKTGSTIKSWLKDLPASLPLAGLAIVVLGTNDDTAGLEAAARQLDSALRAQAKKVIWVGPPKVTRSDIAARVAAVDATLGRVFGSRYVRAPEIPLRDGVHATPTGYATWARTIVAATRGRKVAGALLLALLGAGLVVAAVRAGRRTHPRPEPQLAGITAQRLRLAEFAVGREIGIEPGTRFVHKGRVVCETGADLQERRRGGKIPFEVVKREFERARPAGATLVATQGIWQGGSEPSVIAQVAHTGGESPHEFVKSMIRMCERLACDLSQREVMLRLWQPRGPLLFRCSPPGAPRPA